MAKEKKKTSISAIVDSRIKQLKTELDVVRNKLRDALNSAKKNSKIWQKNIQKKAAEWNVKIKRAEEAAYKKALEYLKQKEVTNKKELLAVEKDFEKKFTKKSKKAKKTIKTPPPAEK